MQPAGQGLRLADRGGIAGQHQEGGLEGVLGIVLVAQDVTADAPDEPSVPLDQGGEGVFLVVGREALQQLRVAQVSGSLPNDQPARSPTLNLVTSGPTAVTLPTISWPGTTGYVVLVHSLRAVCRSE